MIANIVSGTRRRTRVATGLTAVLAAALTLPVPAHAATTKFDGSWSVVALTTSGPCDASYRFNGQIGGGTIYYAYQQLEVVGRVEANGAVSVKITYGSAHAEGHGRLTETHGSGTWSGEGPDGRCTGTWSSTRQSSQ